MFIYQYHCMAKKQKSNWEHYCPSLHIKIIMKLIHRPLFIQLNICSWCPPESPLWWWRCQPAPCTCLMGSIWERFCSIDANEVQDVVDPPICNCFSNFLSEDLFAQHLLHNLSFPLLVHCRGGNIKSRHSIFKTSHLLPPGFPKELPPPMDTFPGSPLSDKN